MPKRKQEYGGRGAGDSASMCDGGIDAGKAVGVRILADLRRIGWL